MVKFIRNDMEKRWNWFESDSSFTLGVATLAHPYFKNKRSHLDKEHLEGSLKRFTKEVKEVAGLIIENNSENIESSDNKSEVPVAPVSRLNTNLSKLNSFFPSSDDESDSNNKDSKANRQKQRIKDIEDEIKMYFQIEISEKQKTLPVLDWCKNNDSKFPNVSVLWRKYLSMPCSSAPSERVFSAVNLYHEGKGRILIENLGKFVRHRINSNFINKKKL